MLQLQFSCQCWCSKTDGLQSQGPRLGTWVFCARPSHAFCVQNPKLAKATGWVIVCIVFIFDTCHFLKNAHPRQRAGHKHGYKKRPSQVQPRVWSRKTLGAAAAMRRSWCQRRFWKRKKSMPAFPVPFWTPPKWHGLFWQNVLPKCFAKKSRRHVHATKQWRISENFT